MARNDNNVSKRAMKPAYRIGLLDYPDAMKAGLYAFADILRAANNVIGERYFEAVWLDLEDAQSDDMDLILVPGFWARSTSEIYIGLDSNKPLVDFIRTRPPEQSIWGYCTGVAILAEAGRLNAGPAAITWWAAEDMKKRFPSVVWDTEQDHLMNGTVATASGVMGYLPLALALIANNSSGRLRDEVANLMVLARPMQVHPAFQSLSLIEQATPLMQGLYRIVTNMDAGSVSVKQVAEQLNVSPRTLHRNVKSETGKQLGSILRKIKLSQVARDLTDTNRHVAHICNDLGFSSESNMRRMFKHETGLTLAEYRRSFGRKG